MKVSMFFSVTGAGIEAVPVLAVSAISDLKFDFRLTRALVPEDDYQAYRKAHVQTPSARRGKMAHPLPAVPSASQQISGARFEAERYPTALALPMNPGRLNPALVGPRFLPTQWETARCVLFALG